MLFTQIKIVFQPIFNLCHGWNSRIIETYRETIFRSEPQNRAAQWWIFQILVTLQFSSNKKNFNRTKHDWSWPALSVRDADVVLFTFDLDFPEGLSCRGSTVDESGGKTVPYRPWKWRILERVWWGRRRRENWYGKRGGNTTVFMPATLWFQHKKSGSWERLRGRS